MLRLTYVSTAAADIGQPDIDDIVAAAARRNAGLDVTGLLAFNGANFMQTLEGAPQVVESLLGAIREDRRHSGIVVISTEVVSARAFPDWAMQPITLHKTGIATQISNGFAEMRISLPEAIAQLYKSFNSLGGSYAAAR